MSVQIFKDPRDRTFLVIGSGLGVSPFQVSLDIKKRCQPRSIKLVFITQCALVDMWMYMLAPIDSYLKPGFELVGLQPRLGQPGMIMSRSRQTTYLDYVKMFNAIASRLNDPVKIDPAINPTEFQLEWAKREMLMKTLNDVSNPMGSELQRAARRD